MPSVCKVRSPFSLTRTNRTPVQWRVASYYCTLNTLKYYFKILTSAFASLCAPAIPSPDPTGRVAPELGAAFAELSVLAPGGPAASSGSGTLDAFAELEDYFKDVNAPISLDLLPRELRTPLEQLTPLTKCAKPSQARVSLEPFNANKAISRELLTAIIGKPERFAELERTVKAHSFSCIDSRKQGPILGTPGGDFGEFLVALSVTEDFLNNPFSEEEIFQLLRQFVTWNVRNNATFFLNTDEAAVSTLASHLHVNGLTRVVTDVDMQNPPLSLRDEMLELLADPVHQGSRILKAFLQFPDKFRLRAGLAPALLRAAHRLLWDRLDKAADGSLIYKRINLEVYSGEPQPRAWISVRSSQGCEVAGAAHAFSPINVVNRAVVPQTAAEKAAAAAAAAAATAAAPARGVDVAQAAATKSFIEAGLSVDGADLAAMGLADDGLFAFVETAAAVRRNTPAVLGKLAAAVSAAKNSSGNGNDTKDAGANKTNSTVAPFGKKYSGELEHQSANGAKQVESDPNLVPVQAFVHHPDAVRDLRKWLSRFFALRFPAAASEQVMMQTITRRQEAVLQAVAESVGSDLPFYTITIE